MRILRNILAAFSATETIPSIGEFIQAVNEDGNEGGLAGGDLSVGELEAVTEVASRVFSANRPSASTREDVERLTAVKDILTEATGLLASAREVAAGLASLDAQSAPQAQAEEPAAQPADAPSTPSAGAPSAAIDASTQLASVEPTDTPSLSDVLPDGDTGPAGHDPRTPSFRQYVASLANPADMPEETLTEMMTRALNTVASGGQGSGANIVVGGLYTPIPNHLNAAFGNGVGGDEGDHQRSNLSTLRSAAQAGPQRMTAADSPWCGIPETISLPDCEKVSTERTFADSFTAVGLPTGRAVWQKPLDPFSLPSGQVWDPCSSDAKECFAIPCREIDGVTTQIIVFCAKVGTVQALSDPEFAQRTVDLMRAGLSRKIESFYHDSFILNAAGPFVHAVGYSAARIFLNGLSSALASIRSQYNSQDLHLNVAIPFWLREKMVADLINGEHVADASGVDDLIASTLRGATLTVYASSPSDGSQIMEPAGTNAGAPARWPSQAQVYIWTDNAAFAGRTGFERVGVSSSWGFDPASANRADLTKDNTISLMVEEGVAFIPYCGIREVHVFAGCPSGEHAGPVSIPELCNVITDVVPPAPAPAPVAEPAPVAKEAAAAAQAADELAVATATKSRASK